MNKKAKLNINGSQRGNVKIIFCLSLSLLLICSCSDSENPEEKFSISVKLIQTDTTHTITDEELITVKRLFEYNDISLNNLQVYRMVICTKNHFHVSCRQFYNDLPVFFEDIGFTFSPDSQLFDQPNERITELDISLIPEISEFDAAKNVHDHVDFLSSAKFYFAELGIYDDYNDSDETCYTLVWNIRTDSTSQYPFAMVDAINNKILAYDSGIRIGKMKSINQEVRE